MLHDVDFAPVKAAQLSSLNAAGLPDLPTHSSSIMKLTAEHGSLGTERTVHQILHEERGFAHVAFIHTGCYQNQQNHGGSLDLVGP